MINSRLETIALRNAMRKLPPRTQGNFKKEALGIWEDLKSAGKWTAEHWDQIAEIGAMILAL